MTNEGERLIRRLHEEVVNGDRLDLLDELIDPSYVNHGPFPRQVVNRDDLERFYLVRELGFPDIAAAVDDIVSEGDLVAYRTTIRGTNTGEFMGLPPTGTRVEATGMNMARVRDGRIVEHWGLLDEVGILMQLGVDPTHLSDVAKT